MNILELQRREILLQTGTARKMEAASSAVTPAVTQSAAQIIDEVETSILSDIKACIARFNRDLDRIAGGARAAGRGAGSAQPCGIPDNAGLPVEQNGIASSLTPDGGQMIGENAGADILQAKQQGASQTVLQGMFRVLLSKAQELITTLTGTSSVAPTGEQPGGIAIESATRGQPLPGGSDASGAQVPTGVIPGLSSPAESDVRFQTGAAHVQDNPDHATPAAMITGIGRQAVPGDVLDAAARMEAAQVMHASLQGTTETGTVDQARAGQPDVPVNTTVPVYADNATTATTARPGPEPTKQIDTEIGSVPTSPSSTFAGQTDRTALGGSSTSIPLYGQSPANSLSNAYGSGQNASSADSSFQSPGAVPAAPVVMSTGPSAGTIENAVIARVLQFVEEINGVLSAAQAEAAAQGEGAYAGREAGARQASPTGGRTANGAAGHIAVKLALADVKGLQGALPAGISVEKDNLLHLDTRLLSSSLSSGKEETLTAVRGFANTMSDKVDTLANVLAAAYMSYNRLPQMEAVRGSEATSSPEQEMTQEQDRLEQRLTELRLLIEKSEFLTNWLQGHVSDDAEFPEDAE